MKITKYYGPPGTGKTRTLIHKVNDLVENHRYDPSKIGYIAFTRAAAEVAKERLDKTTGKKFEWCRTIHSTALKLLDIPRNGVIDPKRHYPLFSRQTGLRLTYHDAFEPVDHDEDDYGIVLRLYDIARNKEMNPEEILWEMPSHPLLQEDPRKYFWQMWNEFKDTHGLIDYLDMLERFVYTTEHEAYPCTTVFLDEAQDLSSLQWRAFDKLISRANEVYIAGDDDQSCHGFSGGSEYGFLEYPAHEEVVLHKSHRVPKAIGDAALNIIERIEHRKTKRVEWVDAPGEIEYSNFPLEFLPWHSWEDEGKSVMALCRTRMLVGNVSNRLSHMNVLHMRDGESILKNREANIVKAFYDIASGTKVRPKIMASVIAAAGFDQEARAMKASGADNKALMVDRNDVEYIDWDCDDIVKLLGERFVNIQEFVRHHGIGVLYKNININVMTMHKSKGRESDIVVIFTDCTQKVKEQEFSPSEIRLAYISLTRAKERVIIMPPDTRIFITHFD